MNNWKEKAIDFYQEYYSFYSKTEEELTILLEREKVLIENCPEEFKEGVHLLGKRMAHCGEDIYIVDGDFVHTIHISHNKCKEYVLRRKDAFWCVHCKEMVKQEELVQRKPNWLSWDTAEIEKELAPWPAKDV